MHLMLPECGRVPDLFNKSSVLLLLVTMLTCACHDVKTIPSVKDFVGAGLLVVATFDGSRFGMQHDV